MESEKWLDRVHNNSELLYNLATDMMLLSRSFRDTGNSIIAETLDNYSKEINKSVDEINRAIGDNLTNQVNESQKAIGKTLEVLLKSK